MGTDVNELDRRAFQRHTALCASSRDSRLYRSEDLWQICGRIGGKTSLLGHQWSKRAERNACISAENFAGLCIACAVRQSGFDPQGPEERASVEVITGIVLQKRLTHAPLGTVGSTKTPINWTPMSNPDGSADAGDGRRCGNSGDSRPGTQHGVARANRLALAAVKRGGGRQNARRGMLGPSVIVLPCRRPE